MIRDALKIAALILTPFAAVFVGRLAFMSMSGAFWLAGLGLAGDARYSFVGYACTVFGLFAGVMLVIVVIERLTR